MSEHAGVASARVLTEHAKPPIGGNLVHFVGTTTV